MQSTAREPFNIQSNRVFGLDIHDAQIASLTRRVLVLAIISALIVIARFAWHALAFQSGSLLPDVIAVFLGLLVPCAGYYGAKRNDENLTCCFCCCNFFGGCCSLFNIFSAWGLYEVVAFIVHHCDPSHPDPDACTMDWQSLFCKEKLYTPQQCFQHVDDLYLAGGHTLILYTVISIPTILLQCLSFCWGKRLYNAIKAGIVIHAPPSQFTTQPIMAQPAQQ